MAETYPCRVQYIDDSDPFKSSVFPEPTRPPTFNFFWMVPLCNQIDNIKRILKADISTFKLEDCALQLYKYNGGQADFGSYLDLDLSLQEQAEDLDGFQDSKKNSIILRTKLSVRVHACIEKLLNSTGRDLKRALFSLKQIFQDDKDLVHEFVSNDGLECLIKVGSEQDQNYQNYILRALGQIMLYVDGMNGVIKHKDTIQWLYTLTASKFRLVVKTALKLLLVFVEYTENNTLLLINAVVTIDRKRGSRPWCNIMDILNEKDGGDSELLIYTMTLVNKVLATIPDQDTFYDVSDALEEQGMEGVVKHHIIKSSGNVDLLEQLQLYEAMLRAEDGDEDGALHQIENIRKTQRTRSDNSRKSRRYSAGNGSNTTPSKSRPPNLPMTPEVNEDHGMSRKQRHLRRSEFIEEEEAPARNKVSPISPPSGHTDDTDSKQRRHRRDRQRSLIEEQEALTQQLKQSLNTATPWLNPTLSNGVEQHVAKAVLRLPGQGESTRNVNNSNVYMNGQPTARSSYSEPLQICHSHTAFCATGKESSSLTEVEQFKEHMPSTATTSDSFTSRYISAGHGAETSVHNPSSSSEPSVCSASHSSHDSVYQDDCTDMADENRRLGVISMFSSYGTDSPDIGHNPYYAAVLSQPFAATAVTPGEDEVKTQRRSRRSRLLQAHQQQQTVSQHQQCVSQPHERPTLQQQSAQHEILQRIETVPEHQEATPKQFTPAQQISANMADPPQEIVVASGARISIVRPQKRTDMQGPLEQQDFKTLRFSEHIDTISDVTPSTTVTNTAEASVGRMHLNGDDNVASVHFGVSLIDRQDSNVQDYIVDDVSEDSHSVFSHTPELCSQAVPVSPRSTASDVSFTHSYTVLDPPSEISDLHSQTSDDHYNTYHRQPSGLDTLLHDAIAIHASAVSEDEEEATTDSEQLPVTTSLSPWQLMDGAVTVETVDEEEEMPRLDTEEVHSGADDVEGDEEKRCVTRDHSGNGPLSPLSPGSADDPSSMSNNRRWMMYKIRHQGSTGEDTPTSQPSPGSTITPGSPRGPSMSPRSAVKLIEEEEEVVTAPDFSGLIHKAKEGLSRSTRAFERSAPVEEAKPQIKKSDSDLQWEEIEKTLTREFKVANLDFTDLSTQDDFDYVEAQLTRPAATRGFGPPPAPPLLGIPPPPPPPPGGVPPPPPPPPGLLAPFGGASPAGSQENLSTLGRSRRTVRLHWREAQAEYALPSGRMQDTVWKRMNREFHLIKLDTTQLEQLFESKVSEIKPKKQEGAKKEITVLDPKRSNAINIGLTVLPPVRTIKTAILKMDTAVLNREGIEKILATMLPTEEEKTRIVEARMQNPDLPLGPAESFLETLASIPGLDARLHLWAFKLDYDGNESEVAEPLNDLKIGVEELKNNKTLKFVLALLLQIGNFLNNSNAKGFTLDYLVKVPEVKDTIQKHSLLHHLVNMVVDQCPGETDLYSDIGPIVRCSKVDFEELHEKLQKLEKDCKSSWEQLRIIAKHDSNTNMKKLSEFLTDAAERIIIMKIVQRRVLNRFHKFLLFLGYPAQLAKDTKPGEFCKVLTEFSLEYKTTREKVLQQREKKATQRERRKTRGKMIVEPEKLTRQSSWRDPEEKENERLQKLLHNGYATEEEKPSGQLGTRTRKRYSLDQGQPAAGQPRRSLAVGNKGRSGYGLGSDSESLYDTADDDMLEAVVKSVTANPALNRQRQRTRARNRDRKSLLFEREYSSASYT